MCYGTAMTNTLPDLRLTIAESMVALADAQAKRKHASRLRARGLKMRAGAETLRWCAAREAPTVEELQAEVDSLTFALEELIENVEAAVATWPHAEACPKDPCQCDLEARRRSALAAVA